MYFLPEKDGFFNHFHGKHTVLSHMWPKWMDGMHTNRGSAAGLFFLKSCNIKAYDHLMEKLGVIPFDENELPEGVPITL